MDSVPDAVHMDEIVTAIGRGQVQQSSENCVLDLVGATSKAMREVGACLDIEVLRAVIVVAAQ
jgi:hypothetical protein